MRKVCFSACFKRKMSSATKETWKTILNILGVSLVMLAGFAIFGLTGWGLSFIWETIEVRNFVPIGFFFYIVLGVIWWMLWLAYKLYKWFTTKTFKLIKEKYENGGSRETCSIFEYCDEIKNENKEV